MEKSVDVDDDDEREEIHEIGGEITLDGRQGHFKEVETIHLKYSQRPGSLKNMCLAQFATSYVYIQGDKIPKRIKWENGSSTEEGLIKEFISGQNLPKYIILKSGTFMSLRNRPLILRIHSSKKKEYMEGIYSECLLYLPWSTEKTDLKENNLEECLDLFNQNKSIIEKNKGKIFPNASMIDAMMELLDSPEGTTPIHLGLDPYRYKNKSFDTS